MPPNDGLDVTGDGIPDLFIGGYSMATDDVQSSSGRVRATWQRCTAPPSSPVWAATGNAYR